MRSAAERSLEARHPRRHGNHFGIGEVAEKRGNVVHREFDVGIDEDHVRRGDLFEAGHPGCSRTLR